MTFDGRVEASFTVPASTTIAVTTNAGGPTTVTVAAGSYYMSDFVTYLQGALIAQRSVTTGTWVVSYSTGASGTGKITIAVTNGTYTITWTSTNLRDLLGFTATLTGTATNTGANQARGLWIPDCPINMDGDPAQAPRMTDLRTTQSPTGIVIGLVGNSFYRHKRIRWSHVEKVRTWIGSESTVNASWERFVVDTQFGLGHAWFTPVSLVQVYDLAGAKVGINANSGAGVSGWYMVGINSTELARSTENWTGMFSIEIPELVAGT